MITSTNECTLDSKLALRTEELHASMQTQCCVRIDRLFAALMGAQYLLGIVLAFFVSPRTWIGDTAYVHLHVWLAVAFGAILSGLPIFMAIRFPGSPATRHIIAIAQGVWSALLIHLTGGRLETHFHVFGSLAFIAFYRDWKVLMTLTLVIAGDHALRGIWWPLSVYGIATESPLRWIEHAVWVVFEDTILLLACYRGRQESRQTCHRQAQLEQLNAEIEDRVRRRTQELDEAKREAEQLALVAKYTDNSVLILDQEGRVEWANSGFERQTGYTLDECRGKIPIDFLQGSETDPKDIEIIRQGLRSQAKFDLEITKHRKDGEPIIVEIESSPIVNSEKHLQYIQIERNITRRKQDERERDRLRAELQTNAEYLAKLALVAQYTSNAVLITDAQGCTEWANEGFTRVTGYSFDEVCGKRPGSVLQGPKTCPQTVAQMGNAIRQRKEFSAELVNYQKDGTPYWAHIQINPVNDGSEKGAGFIGVVSDVTARKVAEQERSRLQRELQVAARQAGRAEVATNVLHNIGNILNSVNVSATVLRERISGSAVGHLERAANVIVEHEATLTEFLVQDHRGRHFPRFVKELANTLASEQKSGLTEAESLLLNIAHIQNIVFDQQSIAKDRRVLEAVELDAVIESAIKGNQSFIEENEVAIETNLGTVEPVKVDRHEIHQIILNLIRNGIHAVSETSGIRKLRLRLEQADGFARIEITDNGVGIVKDQLATVFNFMPSRRTSEQGTSLHESANCATELGGSLTAFSDGLGCGATFILRLPIPRQEKDRQEAKLPTTDCYYDK